MSYPHVLAQRDVVIFDFDGTIADTKAGIIATATRVLSDWGLGPAELAHVGELIGPPFPQAYELVFGLSHADAVEVTRRYRAIYRDLGVEAWPAFAGMRELLVALREAGRRLAVASSKQTALVHRGLADNGILDLFELVRGKEDDAEATKVDAIRLVLAQLQAIPDDAVMVGDRFHDVEASAACGVPCVGVRYGDTARPGELEEAGAVAIANTMDELRALLLGEVVAAR